MSGSLGLDTHLNGDLNTHIDGAINTNTTAKLTGDPNEPIATLLIGDPAKPIATDSKIEILNLPRFTLQDIRYDESAGAHSQLFAGLFQITGPANI